MASFPTIRSGSTRVLYPLTRTASYLTRTLQFNNDKEQRWVVRPVLAKFALEYNEINATDLSTLKTFFDSCKGAYDSTWDITVGGVLYSYMVFEEDDWTATESKPNLWTVRLTLRQTRKN